MPEYHSFSKHPSSFHYSLSWLLPKTSALSCRRWFPVTASESLCWSQVSSCLFSHSWLHQKPPSFLTATESLTASETSFILAKFLTLVSLSCSSFSLCIIPEKVPITSKVSSRLHRCTFQIDGSFFIIPTIIISISIFIVQSKRNKA